MFNNIGGKIKICAAVYAWIGIVASIVSGICIMFSDISVETIFLGLLTCVGGSLVCWVSVFLLYGFGQLIENSDILVRTLAPNYVSEEDGAENLNRVNHMEKNISQEYFGSDWEKSIKTLSDEMLAERIASDDWQVEYKALCKQELERRQR